MKSRLIAWAVILVALAMLVGCGGSVSYTHLTLPTN